MLGHLALMGYAYLNYIKMLLQDHFLPLVPIYKNSFFKRNFLLGVVVHACNARTYEAEDYENLGLRLDWVIRLGPDYPGLQSKGLSQ